MQVVSVITFEVNGNNTDEAYATVFVVINSNEEIIDSFDDLNFDSEGYEPGTYTVYLFNYATVYEELILGVIEGQQIWDELIALETEACLAYQIEGVPFTILDSDSEECQDVLDPLEVINIVLDIADDGLTYTVTFDIIGSTGNYTIDTTPIEGSTFTSEAIDCGTPFSFAVSDDVNSAIIIVEDEAPCERVCTTEMGILSGTDATNFVGCENDETSFSITGGMFGDEDVLAYILHSDADDVFGSLLSSNITGVFAYDSEYSYNTDYYVRLLRV